MATRRPLKSAKNVGSSSGRPIGGTRPIISVCLRWSGESWSAEPNPTDALAGDIEMAAEAALRDLAKAGAELRPADSIGKMNVIRIRITGRVQESRELDLAFRQIFIQLLRARPGDEVLTESDDFSLAATFAKGSTARQTPDVEQFISPTRLKRVDGHPPAHRNRRPIAVEAVQEQFQRNVEEFLAYRNRVRRRLQRLLTELEGQAFAPFETQRDIVVKLRRDLQRAVLCVICPSCDKPALINFSKAGTSKRGLFQFHHNVINQPTSHSVAGVDFPHLEVIDDPRFSLD